MCCGDLNLCACAECLGRWAAVSGHTGVNQPLHGDMMARTFGGKLGLRRPLTPCGPWGGVRLRGYRVPRTTAGGGGRTCNRGRPLQAFSSALAASGTMHANGAALYARKSGQHTGNTACVIPLMGPHALVRNADWTSYARRPPPSVHPTLLKVRRGGDRIAGKAASVRAHCLYTASACSDRRHLCIKSAFGAGVIFLLPVS